MYGFDIDNPEDKFRDLIEIYTEYNDDKNSTTKARSLSVISWELTEWVAKKYYDVGNDKNKLGIFRSSLYSTCPSLKIIHDIANGIKHYTLTHQKSDMKSTGINSGPFSKAFARQYNQTYLKIEMKDGTVLHFEDEIEKVINFWKDYFKNQLGIEI